MCVERGCLQRILVMLKLSIVMNLIHNIEDYFKIFNV